MRSWIRTLAAAAAALLFTAGAHAQADRTLRILVGFPPGGSVDVSARLIAERMAADLKRPVVVDNKPGAGGRIAAELLKNSPLDGTTMMLSPIGVPVIAPLTFSKLAYDPAVDLAPVAPVATFEFALSVGATHPAKSLPELLAWFRANPQQANFGSPAAGSLPHFFGVLISRNANVDMVHVPFTGGAPLVNAMIGGQVASGIDAMVDHIEFHRAGRLRILAVSGTARHPLLPDVPTFGESGVPGVGGGGWFGMYAPGRTPPDQLQALNAALNRALQSPELKERFARLGLIATGGTPADLATIARRDTDVWAPVIKASGFRGD